MPNSLISTEIATVRVPIAPLLSDARASASTVSQLLRGHRAEVTERSGSWLKLTGADGYSGWCHSGYVSVAQHEKKRDDEEAASGAADGIPPLSHGAGWNTPERISLGCVIETSQGNVALPLGAVLDPSEKVIMGLAMNLSGRQRYFAPTAASLVERAHSYFLGSYYLWGGVTPWGADCSGFVQTMFALHGIQLPRDAWQQGEKGLLIEAESPASFQPGDLLFFSDRADGHITHVAIAVNGSVVMHNSLANGGFGINDLQANDSGSSHLRSTFRFARRIF